MARTGSTKKTDKTQAGRYADNARVFLAAAKDLEALAGEDESYGSAVALLAIHSAIAWADTVAIAYGEKKSASGDHLDAVRLLRAILATRLPDQEERRLDSVIRAKDGVAYQGRYYPLSEASALLEKAERFAQWADRAYQERPS